MMWSSTYDFEVTVHQIFADLCPFESFYKLFAAYCLEVIVCRFYFIIGIFFLQITKVLVIWARYGLFLFFFLFFFLLDLQGKVAIIKSI